MAEPTPPSPVIPSSTAEPRVLLGLDTCGPVGTVALLELPAPNPAPVRLMAQTELAGRSFSARLVPAIADLLTDVSLSLAHLAGVIVVVGPGSFTGVRVGLSAAKGLVESIQMPLLAVSRLAILAAVADDTAPDDLAPEKKAVLAVLDAGRGEYFCGQYRSGLCIREWLAAEEDLVRAAAAPLRIVVCEEPLAERLRPLGARYVAPPTAESAVRYALPRFTAADFDDPATTDANYLRSSDAELFRKAARETHAEASAPSPAASHVPS